MSLQHNNQTVANFMHTLQQVGRGGVAMQISWKPIVKASKNGKKTYAVVLKIGRRFKKKQKTYPEEGKVKDGSVVQQLFPLQMRDRTRCQLT